MFLFCSHESSRHFKPPWTLIRENSECYVVKDANGVMSGAIRVNRRIRLR
jgi:hypothetical protein